ncbi:outer membrane receptor protein involved in Fe transport [Tenacibaculum adriaticum]|uniref:Outer membrane receptor protein involved in Fe transport n=1 Tax=Tenacibaculum adriaticum TaxID=413713 RepID=A0A5S5DYS1_9FLAO|nr:outer membrane beta-barrel family protein [Tenacibaculum adriaticum]TYQ00187.1 outer membrane receptor protein involved in Fe transport [Tenacibaculum adriaticum]
MTKLKNLIILLTTILLGYTNTIDAQTEGKITGKVFDHATNNPIEYATIGVFYSSDKSLATGTITDEKGDFTIPNLKIDTYYFEVSFIGYKTQIIENVSIKNATPLDLGTIYLEVDAAQLDEVVINAESRSIDYQIDKKVISVNKELSSASMTAVEVLENTPSIRVDIDGNVLLRGSSGFRVLIDGKPTVLEPSDALKQMPASLIKNIEIITNPSSKYVPDGTGGIINIITKKNRSIGTSSLANLRVGSFGTYGADVLLNYRKGKSNFYISGDYGKRYNRNEYNSERRTILNDTITTISSRGKAEDIDGGWSIRSGWDWDISDNDVFSISARLGDWQTEGDSEANYITSQNPITTILNENTTGYWDRGGLFFNITSNYEHQFSEEGEELAFQINYNTRDVDEQTTSFLYNENNTIINGSRITEVGPTGIWDIRLDYTKPFGEDYILELGSQVRLGTGNDDIMIYEYDDTLNELTLQPERNNDIDYSRDIFSLYSVFKGRYKGLGYQAGLRGEYTNRDIGSSTVATSTTVDRFDLFPSVHLSYDISDDNQIMTNYSRRINRPRSWFFEPFVTWTDLFNVRQGNPSILPEYIDSFELNFIKNWEKRRMSVETYYRVTHNKINRITSVYQEGVLLSTLENVGTDYALGIEAMYNIKPTNWWEMNLTGNTYNYKIEGQLSNSNESFENTSFNWSSRMSNTFSVFKSTKLQVDGNYNSQTVTSQGEEEDYYTINLGIRSDFLDNKLSLSAQVRDVFATNRRTSIVENPTLYNYHSQLSNAPNVSLTLSYKFNNYKVKEEEEGIDDDF